MLPKFISESSPTAQAGHKQSASGIVLCTLNAKYIHASLGLRYLLANMGDLKAQTVLREFTIARKPQEMADELLALLGEPKPGAAQIIGFGVYIWNVTQTCNLIRLLKLQRRGIQIVLGGPEVSHELEAQDIVRLADFVITGWGDISFPKLCRALLRGPAPLMKIHAGEQPPLDQIVLPYAEYTDADLAHRVLYVEASRGCPFKCEFCLSSLDKTAWAFELEAFLAELDSLYQRGARNFKFVDRTFNLKIDASVQILQFFLDRLPVTGVPNNAAYEVASVGASGCSEGPPRARPAAPSGGSAAHAVASVEATLALHFEVIPDHLPDRLKDMIAKFPPGVLQFEVGIQSFNAEVQQRISRRQDNDKTVANLSWLVEESNAHLHTDLIFGLPGETLASFAEGFDRLYALRPHEIQLGILKRLRGTPIARHTLAHGMVYDPLPPYAVQQTGVVSAADMLRFTRLARYWDLFANSGRFKGSLRLLLEGDGAESRFLAFLQFSDWLWRTSGEASGEASSKTTGKTSGFTPEALVDYLFDYVTVNLQADLGIARNTLLADYLRSGARGNPKSLRAGNEEKEEKAKGEARAVFKNRPASLQKSVAMLATRQRRHAWNNA